MGNTLGAIVFLAAGAWLGWKVVDGEAQAFLAAMARGKGGNGGNPGQPSPQPVVGGGLPAVTQGLAPTQTPPDPYALPKTVPNVFGDVFGQSGPINAPQYVSPYGAAPGYNDPGALFDWFFPQAAP